MGAVIAGSTAEVSWIPAQGGADTAALAVTRPDGTAVEPLPSVTGTGAFTASVVTTLPGRYALRWSSGTAVGVDILDVWPDAPRYLVSIDDAVRAVVPSGKMSAEQRDAIQLDLAAATIIIEDLTGPILSSPRTLHRDGGRDTILLPDIGVSGVTVTVDGAALTADGFVADEEAGVVRLVSMPPAGFRNVEIAYSTGSGAVPANLRLACMEQIRFLWQTRRQGTGREAQELGYTPSGYAVPYMVQGLCSTHSPAPGFA